MNDSIKVDWVGIAISLIIKGEDSKAIEAFQNAYDVQDEKHKEYLNAKSCRSNSKTKK